MKTIITGFVALFLMLFSFSFALAENETTNESATPMLISAPVENTSMEVEDNETVSDSQVFWKKVGIAFTFNQEKKAEMELKLAEMELIRARIASKNNNTNAMVKALEAHQRLIARVQERVSKFDEKKNSTERVVGIERAIQAHEAKIARLNNLVATNPNLTAEQIANIQARISQAENNTQHLRDVAEAKLDKLELRRLAMNASGDRVQERKELRNESERLGLNGSGEKLRERVQQRIESRTNNSFEEESD